MAKPDWSNASGFNEAGILHPEKRRPFQCATPRRRCFNEAGILHPEKPGGRMQGPPPPMSFNEAGILHPEKPSTWAALIPRARASMRPGFYTRKSVGGHHPAGGRVIASMRPGFYTRKSDNGWWHHASGLELQ